MASSPDGKEEMKRNNLKLIIIAAITLLTLLLIMGVSAAACEEEWKNPEAVMTSGENCRDFCKNHTINQDVGVSNGYVVTDIAKVVTNDTKAAENDTNAAENDTNAAENDTNAAENDTNAAENPQNFTSEAENPGPTDVVENNGDKGENATENPNPGYNNSQSTNEDPSENTENEGASGKIEKNLFEEIYSLIELNADKIFSILAFIGTLVVGVGYKSGLLPLLSDALTKLKGSIDRVKEDGELSKLETGQRLNEIVEAVDCIGSDIEKMRWQYESYEMLCQERESMHLILEGQIDMLYAIFMTSALPQYQKDEIGERISKMREELKKYEKSEND